MMDYFGKATRHLRSTRFTQNNHFHDDPIELAGHFFKTNGIVITYIACFDDCQNDCRPVRLDNWQILKNIVGYKARICMAACM